MDVLKEQMLATIFDKLVSEEWSFDLTLNGSHDYHMVIHTQKEVDAPPPESQRSIYKGKTRKNLLRQIRDFLSPNKGEGVSLNKICDHFNLSGPQALGMVKDLIDAKEVEEVTGAKSTASRRYIRAAVSIRPGEEVK